MFIDGKIFSGGVSTLLEQGLDINPYIYYVVYFGYTNLAVPLTKNCLHKYEIVWNKSLGKGKWSSGGWTLCYLS